MKSFGYAEVDELPAREPQSGSAEPGLDIAAPAAFLGLAFVYFILSFVGHWLGSNAVEDPILSPSTGLGGSRLRFPRRQLVHFGVPE
jgi:hypothetical protein